MPQWMPLAALSCPHPLGDLGLSFLLFKMREQDFMAPKRLLVLKADKENLCADVSHFSIQHR